MNTGIVTNRWLAAPFLLIVVASSLSIAAEPPSLAKDWAFETIRLKNGYTLKGLVLEETAAGVRFQLVRRATGRPTVCMTSVIPIGDIDKGGLHKLSNEERELLKSRLKELDPTGEGERRRMEKPGTEGLRLERQAG